MLGKQELLLNSMTFNTISGHPFVFCSTQIFNDETNGYDFFYLVLVEKWNINIKCFLTYFLLNSYESGKNVLYMLRNKEKSDLSLLFSFQLIHSQRQKSVVQRRRKSGVTSSRTSRTLERELVYGHSNVPAVWSQQWWKHSLLLYLGIIRKIITPIKSVQFKITHENFYALLYVGPRYVC